MTDMDRKELLQWLYRLEETAVRGGVKTRLLDAVRDCERDLETGGGHKDWKAVCRELEELLGQVKKQMPFGTETEDLTGDVTRKIAEIIDRCKRSKEIRRSEYTNSSSTYIQEAERAMRELSNVEANYDDVTDENRFLAAVGNIGQRYGQQMNDMATEFVDAANQNYQNAFDRLKTLFSTTGYDREAERRFYETYYENQDALIRNAREYACNQEKGEGSIREYGEKAKGQVQQIVKRLKRKAAIRKWIPILAILSVILLVMAGNIIRQRQEASERQEETASQAETRNILEEAGRQFANRAANKMADDAVSKFSGKQSEAVLMVGIPVLIILILLYWLWLRNVGRRCRADIIREAGQVLTAAFEDWRGQGTLAASAEESLRLAEIYMDQQYGALLARLTDSGPETDGDAEDFMRLCADWESIKGKVGF